MARTKARDSKLRSTWALDSIGRPTATVWDNVGAAQRGRLQANRSQVTVVLFAPPESEPAPLTAAERH